MGERREQFGSAARAGGRQNQASHARRGRSPTRDATEGGAVHERSEHEQLEAVVRDLEAELVPLGVGVATIRVEMQREFDRFRHARVRKYVPTLVHREVRNRLRGAG